MTERRHAYPGTHENAKLVLHGREVSDAEDYRKERFRVSVAQCDWYYDRRLPEDRWLYYSTP
jgi:hypothetical protein